MARTPSTMAPLGSPAVDFSLPDTDGKMLHLSSLSPDKPLLLMFICNHCPFVKHVASELAAIGRDYESKVHIVAINSNDADNYPEDSPENMKVEKAERGYTFAYLFDETQEVARAYQAACTPDFFLFDTTRKLFYRGQLDDSRPGNGVKVTGSDLRLALDCVLSKAAAPADQRPSIGCNIKWK
jgi:thiol-disulfide isomerase/thioredoxin